MSMNNALLQGSDRITHLCAHIKKQYRISKWRNMSLYVIMRLWAKYYVLTTRHIKRLDTKYMYLIHTFGIKLELGISVDM